MTQQKIRIKDLPITIRFSYKCKICGDIFDYKSVIRDHLLKTHNITSEKKIPLQKFTGVVEK